MGFKSNAYGWSGSYAFAQYVRGTGADAAGIAADFEVFAHQSSDKPALEQLKSYRSMEDEAFNTCVDDVLTSIQNQEFTSLHNVWDSWVNLAHLSSMRLTPWTKDELRDIVLEAIGRYEPERIQSAEMEQLDRCCDADDMKIWDALERVQQSVEDYQQTEQKQRWQRYLIEGEGRPPTSSHDMPFAHAHAWQIKDRLTAAGRAGVRRMTKFYRQRAQMVGSGDAVKVEVPFATSLASMIEAEIPEGRLSLDQAGWLELALQLRGFAADHAPCRQSGTPAGRAG